MTAVQWPGVVETASAEEKEYALDRAINGLRNEHPLQSASHAVFGWQKPVLIGLLVGLAGFAAWQPMNTAVALIGLCTLGYVLTMTDRVLIFKEGLASRPITISDEAARAIADADLPRYTILVPAYNEPEVVGDLIAAMTALEYPRDKLQILLLAGSRRRRHHRGGPGMRRVRGHHHRPGAARGAAHQTEGVQLRPAFRDR